LLDIVEFCLGRSTVIMPVGPITRTVAWYALLLQLPGGRAFVARPAAREGAASSSRAMLEIGADLEALPFDSLEVNADADSVREQLGRAIGIGENATEREPHSLRAPLEANLGHAVLLCLQRQGELGNRDLLFHRQGEEDGEIARAIRDTLPYFLGAVPRDQAVQRQLLTMARRELRRAENDLARARAADEEVEVSLQAMVREAVIAGLLGMSRFRAERKCSRLSNPRSRQSRHRRGMMSSLPVDNGWNANAAICDSPSAQPETR